MTEEVSDILIDLPLNCDFTHFLKLIAEPRFAHIAQQTDFDQVFSHKIQSYYFFGSWADRSEVVGKLERLQLNKAAAYCQAIGLTQEQAAQQMDTIDLLNFATKTRA